MAFHTAGAKTYNLSSSISSTATSITLSSFTEPVTGTPYTMALLNTSIVYATIDPKTGSSEFISFTGITQNDDGTATLTGVTRGLAKKSPFTGDSDYALPHAGQAQFIISDPPQVFEQYGAKANNEAITGYWTVPDPLGATDIANRQWVLSVVNGGAVSVNSIIVAGTAGETIVAGNLVYLNSSDGYWWKTDADTIATVEGVQLGIAQGSGSAAGAITGGVLLRGVYAGLTGTAGAKVYASNTAGGVSTSVGTHPRTVGNYLPGSAGLYFDPNFQDRLPEYAVDAVGTDAYAVTIPGINGYYAGLRVSFKAGTVNTGACSLNVNSLGAINIKKNVDRDPDSSDIRANQVTEVEYDGTNFQIISAVKMKRATIAGGTTYASLPITVAHSLGATPVRFVCFFTGTTFGVAQSFGSTTGVGRLGDGAALSDPVLGQDVSNYFITNVTADATNITIASAAAVGTPTSGGVIKYAITAEL